MKYFILSAISMAIFGCGPSSPGTNLSGNQNDTLKETQIYGEKITPDSAISMDELDLRMKDKLELAVKVKGRIGAVCQKKGCWMDLEKADGGSMRVTFLDYGFFMPKDCAGKTAIVDGIASVEETSVADLKEYAKDAGKSKAEIDAISEPKKELVFEAKGVILQ